MNTYDPAHDIRYVHLAAETDPPPTTRAGSGQGCNRLPVGYANRSPQTWLRSPRKAPATKTSARSRRHGLTIVR